MQQEIEVPAMKLQSMVYQLMRLCEKLEAYSDRGIQRDLELKETIESLNETIGELNQVGPILGESIKEVTRITANKIYNDLLGNLKKDLEKQVSNVCYKLSKEADRVEKIVKDNEKLVVQYFLLFIGGAILTGVLIGIFITFKFLI